MYKAMTSGDKGEAGEKGRTGDFGFPGPQVYTEYAGLVLLSPYTVNGLQVCFFDKL